MADTAITPTAGQLRLSTRRPQVIDLSTLTVARSGVARSGVTRSGYTSGPTVTEFDPFLDVTLHDDYRVQNLDIGDLNITHGLNTEPSTLTAQIVARGEFPVRRGHEIKVYQGGVDTGVPLFAGHALRVTQSVTRQSHEASYTIEAVDYRWLLDRFSLVSKVYMNRGVNTIVADLLATYADPASGFVPGYLDQSLGTVGSIEFNNLRLTQCLERLAATVDGPAFWGIDAGKRVSIFTEPHDEGNLITVGESGAWRTLERTDDLAGVVNRVIFIGGGSSAAARAGSSATTISVEETGWYNPAGGSVRAGCQTVTYTGLSIGSGAGDLTGVSGVTDDIPQGARIYNLYQADDTDAQAALAADLGGGQSGIATHTDSDHRLGYDRTQQAGEALLDALKTAAVTIRYDITPTPDATDDTLNYIRPGRLVTMAVTTPNEMTGSFRVRAVTLSPHSRRADGSLVFRRRVTASTNRRTVVQTLTDALEEAS